MVTTDKIGKIEFRMLSPQMIKKMAVVKVVTPDLYDVDGYPVDGGLMDLKMGVIDPGLRCRTCGGKVHECPGHFGYIELARPVFHVKYVQNIYDILRATCSECGRILISDKDLEKIKKKGEKIKKEKGELAYWEYVKQVMNKAKNAKVCPHCGKQQKKIRLEKPYSFIQDGKKLTPVDVRARLEKIPDKDLEFLGIKNGRPEWMVLTLLPVPPPSVRPSITLETGERSEDDLTHKLGDIVRTNQRLYENLNAGAPEIIIEDLWDLLQYHVATYFVNNISQIPPARHRSGRVLKTLGSRIGTKEGRFRNNLLGKRVNFSARTVISPDPRIGLDEVGIPYEVAKELTVPVRVTEWNVNYLKSLIKNMNKYPGANYVITPDGIRKKITEETVEPILEELSPGYVVERQLQDGDIVLFNRQPSLHRMSIMAHKVRVLPYKTFRINPAVVIPYNADFDGDEMNLHVPQTEEAIAEAEILASVERNMVTPRYGLPIVGEKQDQILGNYLLTMDGVYLNKRDTARLLSYAGIFKLPEKPKIKGGEEYYSGKQIFSMILPDGLNFEGNNRLIKSVAKVKESDYRVIIKNGKLISGIIDSSMIGAEAGKGKITEAIIEQFGRKEAMEFLYRASLLGIGYLDLVGFTMVIDDTDLPKKAIEEIKEILNTAKKQVSRLIEMYEKGKLEPYPGRSVRETLEFRIAEVGNRCRNLAQEIVERELKENNNVYVIARSGARGSLGLLVLMSALVGQVSLRGSRINRGYYKRTLPHFKRGDISLEPGGFIRHSYKAGLSPIEFFFNSITGRDTLMDTSMRTPKSGYLQRRLINALQDLRVEYDRSVRDGTGKIIQFLYGEDGIDVSKSNFGKVKINVA